MLLKNNPLNPDVNFLTALIANTTGRNILAQKLLSGVLKNIRFVLGNKFLLLKYIPWFGSEFYERFISLLRGLEPNNILWSILHADILISRLDFTSAYNIYYKYLEKFARKFLDKTTYSTLSITLVNMLIASLIVKEKLMFPNQYEEIISRIDPELFQLVIEYAKCKPYLSIQKEVITYIGSLFFEPELWRLSISDGWLSIVEGALLYYFSTQLGTSWNLLEIGPSRVNLQFFLLEA